MGGEVADEQDEEKEVQFYKAIHRGLREFDSAIAQHGGWGKEALGEMSMRFCRAPMGRGKRRVGR
jgi:hypothetical protein